MQGLAFDPLHSRWRRFMIIKSRKCSSIHNVHLLSVLLSSTRAIVEFQSPFHQFATVATTHREGQQNPIEHSYEKEHAHKIFNLASEVRFRKTDDDILDSLLNNQDCCAMQPSNSFVDNLLQRFNDDWKWALGLFRWASSRPGYRHSPEAYDKMVDILGKAKQIEKMWALVEEMRGGGIITRNTVAKIMRRLAGAGRLKDAVKVFDELLVMGVEKDVESMNLLLDTLCKEKRVELAREVFLELKAHITPNAHTFNIFIHGWCKVNRIDEAHWTIQEMKGYGVRPSVITYSTIIQAYCNQFNFCKVNELLDEMKIEGCSPNVVTYTTIMHSLAKSQETEEALQIFERMKADGCKPDTVFYNSLIYILGKAGQLSKAVHVFEVEMCKNGISPNVSTYNTMISVFCHHSEERNALNVLREMEESGLCKPDLLTYNPLLKQCFKTGKTDINLSKCESAYLLFEEMISQEITPRYRTCRVLLEELEQKNMNDHVERLKTYMKQMKGSTH
ncbi:pentatricopeptide repeat-containing protein At3g04130, mitochondrial-like isoform X2 [Magnolia sinica]|uniref:pentatricopeptide repeat-containing protein At3g04130, mitochondrial-like isoform X2 n=1 Tax=Magnolia sinica TaxID=86752 RepID=UPI002659CED1|nr:pentatricopeptide repeat-containing protein At3g04130, mitochondrial-like isoform X2 [Magnolia sinica]